MTSHRTWILLVATILVALTLTGDASAQARVVYSTTPGVGGAYGLTPTTAGGVTYVPTHSYYYNPYVAPYPGYGILPPPFVQGNVFYGTYGVPAYDYRNPVRRTSDDNTRKRPTGDPALAFEKAPPAKTGDARRVRFEVNVPKDDAIVVIDGVQTKQTGTARLYFTPPLEDDRLYTSRFDVRWTDAAGKARNVTETFEFLAGDTIKHTFK